MPTKADTLAKKTATDPNSEPEQLFKVMKDFPAEVLSNPSFELLAIERPNLWEEIAENHWGATTAVANLPNVPPALVEFAIRDDDRHLAEALLRNAHIDLKQKLAIFARSSRSPIPKIEWPVAIGAHHAKLFERAGLDHGYYARHEPAKGLTREEIAEVAELGVLGLWLAINHPFATVEILDRARKINTKDYEIRATVARHPEIPAAWMEEFALDPELYIRGAVARNPNASPELLRKLSKDKERGVLLGVAENTNIPEDIAIAWATKSPSIIRVAIAANEHVSPKVLKISAADKLDHVRKSLAANKGAPAEICEILAKDPNPAIRAKLATRTHVPPAILLKLTKDKDPKTAKAALKNSKTPKSGKPAAKKKAPAKKKPTKAK